MRTVALAMAALLGVPASGCEREAQGTDCICEPQTALETPFDNGSSTLGAGNVQDALDELAARPMTGRMYFTPWLYAEPAPTAGVGLIAPCDDSLNDLPLAVSCLLAEGGSPDPTVIPILVQHGAQGPQGAEGGRGFCDWFTLDGRPWGGRFKMRVLCLDSSP